MAQYLSDWLINPLNRNNQSFNIFSFCVDMLSIIPKLTFGFKLKLKDKIDIVTEEQNPRN